MAERRNKSAMLMDATKRKLKLPSDYALAKYLGVHPSKVSNEVRTGKRTLQLHMIVKMAVALNLDWAAQIIQIELEREKDKDIRKYWREALKVRGYVLGQKRTVINDEQHNEPKEQNK